MKLHTRWLPEKISRIRIAGGASACSSFRQIIADVFQADVEILETTDAAPPGAALRTANSVEGIAFDKLCELFCRSREITRHDPGLCKTALTV